MAGPKYHDFELRIERDREGFRAVVTHPAEGKARQSFQLPFTELELENYLLKIGQRRSTVRRANSPEMGAAQEFGSRLYDAVFAGDLGASFRSCLDQARREDAGLRLRLCLDDTPELADLPWEFLYQNQTRQFLTLSTGTPLVRYLDVPGLIKPLTVRPPLRALVMISSPSDYETLDVEKEWTKLREAVSGLEQRGLLVVDRLKAATLGALQQQLRKADYHVFHFIGHGGFDPKTQEGVLVLEDDLRRGHQVSGQDLGTFLHDEDTLRLVILNSCEGARASLKDPFSGTAQNLVLKGIPAVIAMQFEVSDDAAIVLAQEFYGAVADGYPVDAALSEARKAILGRCNNVEFGTPVLYLRSPDGQIFDVQKSAAPPLPSTRPVPPPVKPAPQPQPVQTPTPVPKPPTPEPMPTRQEQVPISPVRQSTKQPGEAGPPAPARSAGLKLAVVFVCLGLGLGVALMFILPGLGRSNDRKGDAAVSTSQGAASTPSASTSADQGARQQPKPDANTTAPASESPDPTGPSATVSPPDTAQAPATIPQGPPRYRVRLGDGTPVGPVGMAKLLEMVDDGDIEASTLVKKEGTRDWIRADTIPEVERALSALESPAAVSAPAPTRDARQPAARPTAVSFGPGAWHSEDTLGVTKGRFQFNADGTFSGTVANNITGFTQQLFGGWTYVIATSTLSMSASGTLSVYRVESKGAFLHFIELASGTVFVMTPE